MNRVYFDNAATTAVSETAAAKALSIMTREYANPSSVHSFGAAMERELRAASEKLADILRTQPEEIIFTSGGTEANNLAVLGTARANWRGGRHIITSPVEHPSVEEAVKALEQEGFAVTRLKVDEQGLLGAENVLEALREDTILVSLIHVNNETGAVLDIADIAQRVKKAKPGLLVHADGVQGFCKHPLDLKHLDLYSVSAHKIHGMKGAGALYVKKGTKIKPLLFGGGQQGSIRPGTENMPGILSMAEAAAEQVKNAAESARKAAEMKAILAGLAAGMADTEINGPAGGAASPYILNMSFAGLKGETLVHALAEENIYISTGAACGSKRRGHSTLIPLGLSERRLESAVRFSFSGANTIDEALICREAILKLVPRLRTAARRGGR